MALLGVKLEALKKSFFNRDAVKNAMDVVSRRALNRWGAFVRLTARRSIRKRKGTSSPGEPPTSHTDLLRGGIYYAWDSRTQSVVVGPVLLNGTRGEAPEALEKGGISHVQERLHARRGGRGKVATKLRQIYVRKRPYMEPAAEKGNERLATFYRDARR